MDILHILNVECKLHQLVWFELLFVLWPEFQCHLVKILEPHVLINFLAFDSFQAISAQKDLYFAFYCPYCS